MTSHGVGAVSATRGSSSTAVSPPGPLETRAAAERCGCSRVTIIRAIRAGDLPARRLGPRGSYRLDAADLEAWLQPARTDES
jgi:excisionase family DNA binding protein